MMEVNTPVGLHDRLGYFFIPFPKIFLDFLLHTLYNYSKVEEIMEKIIVNCNICGNVQSVLAETKDLDRYLVEGELVQKVWPEKSANWRELMIGWRSGFYVCPVHWDLDDE
jgi:hypothetical protein